MVTFEASSFLLQWAVGVSAFGWVTTRRREVGIGYGWLTRGVVVALAAGAVAASGDDRLVLRDVSAVGVVVAALFALFVSWRRRGAGVALQRAEDDRRTARVASMTGIERDARTVYDRGPEFPPVLDLVVAVVGLVGLVAAGAHGSDPAWIGVARMLIGSAFLGCVTDAMSLGHWYLVQPGLRRAPLLELVRWLVVLWPLDLAVWLIPTGMVSVLNGSIDDGYNGMLGWFWVACVVATIGLVVVTRAALRERQYSAVMAATGLLYLAILTAFGMDLVARVLLAT